MNKLKISFFLLIFFASSNAFSQSVTVNGPDGSPLAGSHILWSDTGRTMLYIADSSGTVLLERNSGTLQVSAVGYETLYITLPGNDDIVKAYLKKSAYGLEVVVITAQYQPTKVWDAVHRMRVIGASEIKARGAINLGDVLRNELNFRVSQDNVLGSGLSMMGISGENVKILIDGVPVIGRLDGNIDLNQINLNNVERIEVVEGPLAVNYGSNAMAGTINIITKAPAKNEHRFFAESYAESSGHYNVTAGGSTSWKDQAIQVTGGRNYFDGWNPGDDPLFYQRSGRADLSRSQQWNPREQIFGDAKYRVSKSWGYFELTGALFDEEIINRGTPNIYGERALDDVYSTLRRDFSAKYQTSPGKTWNMHVIAAFNQYERIKNTFSVDLTGVNRTLSDQVSLQDTSTFTTWLSRGSAVGKLRNNLNIQIGYEAQIETAAGVRISDATGQIGNYALFATAEWKPLVGLTLKPGMRYAYNTRYDAPLIPSLNALYDLGKNRKIRASYAQGFRSPGLKELSFYFVDINHNIIGNADLEAEYGHHFQIAFDQNPSEQNPWGYGISGFYNDLASMITLAQVSELEYTYINIGESKTTGIQGSVKYQKEKWNVDFAGVYTGVSNQLAEDTNLPEMNFFPELRTAFTYEIPKWNLSASVFYKYNGQQTFFVMNANDQVQESFISDFHSADITLSKKFWKDKISFAIGSKNLFDIQNIATGTKGSGGAHSGTGSSQPMATGRTYFARLGINFGK